MMMGGWTQSIQPDQSA